MKRIPEPELMDSEAQTQAYADADFADSNTLFVETFLARIPDLPGTGKLVDLGCGPADICVRLARALPGWSITGLDAGPNMLRQASRAVSAAGLEEVILLHLSHLPDTGLPERSFDAVISNSLLHHLPSPKILWDSVHRLARPGAAVAVMDLARPDSPQAAAAIVQQYASEAPDILREDFYNSLLAAYTVEEIARQLEESGLGSLGVERPSDRHWMVSGRLPA